MPIYIGCSGWQYKHWRRAFYPDGVAQRRWLDYYTARFRTVELNNSFYRLPEAETFKKWADSTPDDFVMAVKASRYLTHIRRLREPEEPVARFSERARFLGGKLGPVLLQLPPNLQKDGPALHETLSHFDRRIFSLCVEFRHESWFDEEVEGILEEHGAALVLADRGSKPITPVARTTDWGYVRFHWGTGSPESCYGRTALASWAERISGLWGPEEDVFVYFNNDPNGCALRDASVFARECEKRDLRPTRVPGTHDVHLDLVSGRQS